MREIKFRGKSKNTGEWVYGSLYIGVKDINFETNKKPKYEDVYIITTKKNTYNDSVEVIPETVEQFTGLHDKNGKEIYEGDIVIYGDIHHTIEENMGCFIAVPLWDSDYSPFIGNINNQSEIIGNIHENPELIK